MINISNPLKTQKFIDKAVKIHGYKFNYSLVDYKKAKEPIVIICEYHGPFTQFPNSHLCGQGCPSCRSFLISSKTTQTTVQFLQKAINKHGNKVNYSLVNYLGSQCNIDIICNTHGIFKQTPNSHLMGQGCPRCKNSYGENYIENFLNSENINFISQKKFEGCINFKSKRKLPFDFYLPDYNICIEFQGEQHYKPVDRFGGVKEFFNIKERDKIKKDYCIRNSISYIELNKYNIEKIRDIICINQYIKREENQTLIEDTSI